MIELKELQLHGAGGGSKPKKARVPVEAPNTLQSVVKGRILDLIGYGPIEGLVDGLKSVYLDDTPVMNPDNSLNFQGITLETREGLPDQDYISGFSAVENTFEINTEVMFESPPVRSVSNNDADAALITVQVASLSEAKDNGDVVAYSVSVEIDVRSGGGAWSMALSDTISGKTTSPYPRTYRVPLNGSGPFDIRVRRTTPESVVAKIQDRVDWTLLTEVIDARLSYPNMALVGIEVDSELFGQQLPSRTYDVKLSIISVPTNYDPITRVYTGLWDGTFKQAWTDNPAWCFYDLATHPVIGAGLQNVDKWTLYSIAQYCDELVPDGYGGMEPRFTCNTILGDQEEAVVALNTFASIFRGMAYWGTNTMVPVADKPTLPVKIVSPANVVDGDFDYTGTSLRERHSVAVAMWNNPDDRGKAIPEIYEDEDSIILYGWRETRVTAVACNSRGQARRLAKWILDSERTETDTLTYKATLDHADLRPGDVIEVADPDHQGARMAGRVMSSTINQVVLDQVPPPEVIAASGAWFISVLMPDGTVVKSQVSSFAGNNANLLVALPSVPVKGAMWALSSLALALPQFRVVSVSEDPDTNIYTITATEYDPTKYARVELGINLPAPPTSLLPTGPVSPPLDLTFETYKYFAGNSDHQGLVISWTPAKDPRVTSYILDVKSPQDGDYRTVYNGAGTSFDLKDIIGGQWSIRVRALTSLGITSQWVFRNVQIATLLLPVPPDSVQVTVGTFEVTLWPISAYPHAVYEFWRSDVPLAEGQIETNATQLPTGNYLVDAGLRAGRTYFYFVRGTNQYGLSSWFAVQATTEMNFEDILEAVTEDITSGALYTYLNAEIEGVATSTATTVVNNAVAGLEAEIDAAQAAVAALETQVDELASTLEYDPSVPYLEGETTRVGKRIYAAIQNVPVSTPPPNALYWKDVGVLVEDVNGLALSVQQNTASIGVINGAITFQAESISALRAAWRDDDGEGDIQDALRGWETLAEVKSESKVRVTENEAMAQQITAISASVSESDANITTLQQTVATLDSATAQQITTINASVSESASNITSLQQTVAALDSATSQSIIALESELSSTNSTVDGQALAISSLSSSVAEIEGEIVSQASEVSALRAAWRDDDGEGDIQDALRGWETLAEVKSESKVRVTENEAMAQQITVISASVSQSAANITTLQQTVATLDSATATSIQTLNANVASNTSAIQNEATARANADSAMASNISTLQSSVAGNTAAIQTTSQAVANLDGTLSTMWAVKLQLTTGGRYYAAGMGVDLTTHNGVTQSQILFQADRFALVNVANGQATVPFFIDGGVTYMTSAMIKAASIDFAKISDTIQSDNYVANTSGWKLSKNGGFEINGAVAGQGKVQITNQVIKVYDANNVLRVKMGNLSA